MTLSVSSNPMSSNSGGFRAGTTISPLKTELRGSLDPNASIQYHVYAYLGTQLLKIATERSRDNVKIVHEFSGLKIDTPGRHTVRLEAVQTTSSTGWDTVASTTVEILVT